MPRDLITLEIRAKFGLVNFVRGKVFWEGEHVLTSGDSKGLTKELVSQVSSSLRKIGCRCVLDETIRTNLDPSLDCINRFEPLSEQADSSCRDEHMDTLHVEWSAR